MATDDGIGGPQRNEPAHHQPAHGERQLGRDAQGRRRILLAVGAALLLVVVVAVVVYLIADAADDVEGAAISAAVALSVPVPARRRSVPR
jgi:membrane-anchored protein YejM (alkaline phosphatase superfamily)